MPARPGVALVALCAISTLACAETLRGGLRGESSSGSLDDAADLPDKIHEAFRVAGIFERMVHPDSMKGQAGASTGSYKLPQEDISQLLTNPLEAAERAAVAGIKKPHGNELGEASQEQSVGNLDEVAKANLKKNALLTGAKKNKISRGDFIQSHGTQTFVDFLTIKGKKEDDMIIEQEATNEMMAEEGVDDAEVLLQVGEDAHFGSATSRRRGQPDIGLEQPRKGWTHRYPGIQVDVEGMAPYVVDGATSEAELMLKTPKSLTQKANDALDRQEELGEQQDATAPQLVGCYADNDKSTVLPDSMGSGIGQRSEMSAISGGSQPSNMEPLLCSKKCRAGNYLMMALQTIDDETFCYCGHNTEKAQKLEDAECNKPCQGNPGMLCGGPMRASVYNIVPEVPCFKTPAFPFTGPNVKQPWHRYEGCAACAQSPSTIGDQWQEWGNPMPGNSWAGCLSCDKGYAFVMTDPKKQTGFCRPFNPTPDVEEAYTYPYYAHNDGESEFVHTMIAEKYTKPHFRKGTARATCQVWKQTVCEVPEAAHLKTMTQPNDNKKVIYRMLGCRTARTVKCKTVCVSTLADCGTGAKEYMADDTQGLAAVLRQKEEGVKGKFCCYDDCQIPSHHETYKEDASFWCKDHVVG